VVSFISLVTWQCLRQPQLTSTPTNLPSSSSRRLKECVLPPTVFDMMYLRNFWQVSVKDVQQVMTHSPVKSSAIDRQWRVVGWRLETIGVRPLRTPCEKFLATPLTIGTVVFDQWTAGVGTLLNDEQTDRQTDRRRHQLKPPPTRRVSGYCTSQDSPWYPGGHWQCSTSKALDWPVSLSTAMSKLTSLRLHHITNQAGVIELFTEDSNINPLTPTVAIWVQLEYILCQTGFRCH